MKITAKTIALELGISTATVDRALNNRGGVKPETVYKIKQKANELNYKPNKSASFLSRKKNVHVAFVFPHSPEYFWKEIELGIKQTLEDFKDYGFNVDIIHTGYDEREQISIVTKIIESNNYDALVLAPTDAIPFTSVINRGIEKGLPIFTLNNDSPSSKRISYVGADYVDSGILAGELLNLFSSSTKKFAIIKGADTFQMQQKIQGFREYIMRNKEIELVGPITINAKEPIENIAKLEQSLQGIDGVYVACGALAEVAKAIQVMDIKSKPILVGHDISEEINDYLQRGVVTATICQDPAYQATLAVRILFNHLMLDKKVNQIQNIVKLEVVTKGNAKYYV